MIKLDIYGIFKTKIKNYEIGFPSAAKVSLFVYAALIISVAIGIITAAQNLMEKSSEEDAPEVKVPTSPPKNQAVDKNRFSEIFKRNIFNIDGTIPEGESQRATICAKEPTKSSISLQINGIIYGGSGESSTILFGDPSTQAVNVYRVGDKLPQGAKIIDILPNKVIIVGRGCPEYIALEYPGGGNKAKSSQQNPMGSTYAEKGFERSGFTTTATKQWVNNILNNNLTATLADARAVPNVVNGQVKGFTLTQIAPNSVYEKLGFQNGDVINSINGIELNDAARAIQTLNALRNESQVELAVSRGGQSITFNLSVQQ